MCHAEMHGLATDAKMPVVRQGRLKVSGDVGLDKIQRAHDKTSVCDRATEIVCKVNAQALKNYIFKEKQM